MKKFLLLISSLLMFNLSLSQTMDSARTVVDSLKTKEKKLKFNSGFGLNFVGGTSISLSPSLTYNVSDKFRLGAGLQGSYNDVKNLQTNITFGANVLGFYNLSKKIMTTLEFAQLRVSNTTTINGVENKKTFWESALFAGAGVNITKKITIGAKYNFLYKEDESVYTSPIIPFVNISF